MRRATPTLIRVLILAGAVAAILSPWGCQRADVEEIQLPAGNTARIVFVTGEVYFLSGSGGSWNRAEVGDTLDEGTLIRTGENSYCEFVITSGTIYRMKDRSELQLASLPEDSNDNKALMHFVRGVLLSRSGKVAFRSDETIETETVTLGIRGTAYRLRTTDEEGSRLMVGEGKVKVTLNLDMPDPLPDDLAPVLRRVRRGTRVKRGFTLQVSPDLVESVSADIARITGQVSRGREVDRSTLDRLVEKVRLSPTLIREKDAELLDDLDSLQVNIARGETFHLSPNFDGLQDELVFSTAPYGNGKSVTSWKLVILDGTHRRVQVVSHRIPEYGNGVDLPPQIRWNLVSRSGTVVEDGNYVYEFYMNGELLVRGVIIVDRDPPDVSLEAEELLFSPNGDGVKDTLQVRIDAEHAVAWSATISTEEGIVVRAEDWGEKPPQVFEWDGRGDNGNLLPDGVYVLVVTGTDRAGNRGSAEAGGITIDVRERQATVDIDTPFFSPNGDGMLDKVTFTPILSDSRRIDTWDLIIQTERGETARRFRGWGWIPKSIIWDGTPTGKLATRYPEGLPSGRYSYFLQVYYKSGVNTYSFKREFLLDNIPPDITVDVSPTIFSPDGDGVDDTLTISADFLDDSPMKSWRALILTGEDTPFKQFSGQGMSDVTLSWDGVSDRGELVDSAGDYQVVFEATDAAYNEGKSEPVSFSVDILVIPTERGLKIRVSNVEFGFNTAELTGEKTYGILDRIVSILNKYERYSVVIEGHTDSTDNEEYNVDLSRRRAESVGAYLIDRGINPNRLRYEGHGSQYPIDTNETREGRRRNRRVEFLLIRR